ncbi:MAG: aminopeptidase [Gemmatimonadota bacterium]
MLDTLKSVSRRRAALVIVAAWVSLTPISAPAQGAAPNWERIAQLIVQRIAPAEGERVLLVGAPGVAEGLIPPLRRALVAAGARDLGVVAVTGAPLPGWSTPFTTEVAASSATLRTVDVGIMLPGATVGHAAYDAMQQVLREARGSSARTIHFHWIGAYSLAGGMIEVTPERAAVYQRALLETDYAALAARQSAFERAMRGNEVRVTTAAGTDIRFRIGERPVTRQDGDASAGRARQARNLIDREIELPAGAIRVAPMEETVSGTIAFPLGDWGGERVEGLVMRFERGRVVSFDARSGREGVERELQRAGAAGRAFREFALGLNPLLAIPRDGERWIPYYGYGAGVVRLSLGDNSELGGAVTGGYVRWNFFTDATVTVGREVWVRDGVLMRNP